MAIHERTLEQLLTAAPALLEKQYTCVPHRTEGELHWLGTRTLTVAGKDAEGALYITRKNVSKTWPPHRGDIGIDDDGHPYYTLQYGDHAVPVYDRLLLGNTGFACAMAGLHQEQMDRVRKAHERTRHPLLERFTEYIDDFITRVPALKDRLVRAYYRGELKEALKQVPYVDQAALGLLALKDGNGRSLEFDLAYTKRPGAAFLDQPHVTPTKRKELFQVWYRSTIDTKTYERKIAESEQAHNRAFEHHLRALETSLKNHGFRKVDAISSL